MSTAQEIAKFLRKRAQDVLKSNNKIGFCIVDFNLFKRHVKKDVNENGPEYSITCKSNDNKYLARDLDGLTIEDVNFLLPHIQAPREKTPREVIKMTGVCFETFTVFYDFVPTKMLRNYLNKEFKFEMRHYDSILKDICNGMRHLISRKFIGPFLTSYNLRIIPDGSAVRAQICYYEPIFTRNKGNEVRDIVKKNASSPSPVPIPQDHIIRYFPRELVSDVSREFTESAAVYQFGVVIYEMMSKKHPYHHIETVNEFLEEVVTKARPLTQFAPISSVSNLDRVQERKFLTVMEQCFSLDEKKRPSFDELSKYFKS